MRRMCLLRVAAMDAIKEQFSYDDMSWALSKGALCYSCYFIASFPLVYWLDEPADSDQLPWSADIRRTGRCSPIGSVHVNVKRWSVAKTVENALAAGKAQHQLHYPSLPEITAPVPNLHLHPFLANIVLWLLGLHTTWSDRDDRFHLAGFGDTVCDYRLAQEGRVRQA